MHPLVDESRLRLRLTIARWWGRQREEWPLGVAVVVGVGVVGWALRAPLKSLLAVIDRFGSSFPWVAAALLSVLCASFARRGLRPLWWILEQGRWSVQPGAALERHRSWRMLVAATTALAALASLTLLLALPTQRPWSSWTSVALVAAVGVLAGARLARRPSRGKAIGTGSRQGMAPWPEHGNAGKRLQAWLRGRIGADWRHGGLSLGGVLLIGLAFPGGTGPLLMFLGLTIAGLTLRLLVVLQSAGRLLLQAHPMLSLQPLPMTAWRSAHRDCVMPRCGLLVLLIGASSLGLGAPWPVAVLACLMLIGLAWLDTLILSICLARPRRRQLVWTQISVAAAVLVTQLWLALPVLLLILIGYGHWRLRRYQSECF
jgi:hypothetical protein